MNCRFSLAMIVLLAAPVLALAQNKPPTTAPSRVVAVTVYRGSALVTRQVEVPEGGGLIELVVTPLPPHTIDSSLYSEGTDGLRILSTRYRTRAVKDDVRAEVRAKEQQIRSLQDEAEKLQKQVEVITQNLALLGKLESFTSATMQTLAEKGLLSAETTIALAKHVMETRAANTAEQVALQHSLRNNAEATAFAQRELTELSAGSGKTERDAVIVIDKSNNARGSVRLNYLVNAATWRPQYKLRAGAEREPVQVEYLAAIQQQSGEDWNDVNVVLSTAEPMLNAAPPELAAMDVTITARVAGAGGGAQGQAAAGPPALTLGAENRRQVQQLRSQAKSDLNRNDYFAGNTLINSAAALEQTEELFSAPAADSQIASLRVAVDDLQQREGPSVTYHLKPKLSLPSRNDEQLLEVARLQMAPSFFYKAVPVLTPHVYRQAELTNTTEYVLLAGEATMYLGTDFVGRMKLPLVAIGERFTAGFGVDPQLQVTRELLKKSRSLQGGNQVHELSYRIRIASFKSTPATVQVWDRLPRAEAEAVGITLVDAKPSLSTDPTYVRAQRPANLLRWDLTVEPGANGEKAVPIDYSFRMEYDRNVAVGNFRVGQ
jgi:hypothetical protein